MCVLYGSSVVVNVNEVEVAVSNCFKNLLAGLLVVLKPQVSSHFNDPLAGLLVIFKNLIISQRSKHIMHTILKV